MFDPKQPLWLPAGSVRAILAIVLVLAIVLMAFMALGYALSNNLLDGPAVLSIVMAVVALVQLVVGAYFVSKASQPRG